MSVEGTEILNLDEINAITVCSANEAYGVAFLTENRQVTDSAVSGNAVRRKELPGARFFLNKPKNVQVKQGKVTQQKVCRSKEQELTTKTRLTQQVCSTLQPPLDSICKSAPGSLLCVE